MSRYLAIAPVLSALGFTAAMIAPAPARADDLPAGSYRQTCSNIRWVNDSKLELRAVCKPKASDTAAPTSNLFVFGCVTGTIRNDDGKLACNPNGSTKYYAPWIKNRQAFRSAAAIILGWAPTDRELLDFTIFGATYGDHRTETMNGELDFSTAALVLRLWLQNGSYNERRAVYNAAYKQVYGYAPVIVTDNYDPKIKAGQAWYATLVIELTKQKNAPVPKATGTPAPLPPIH